MVFTSVQFKHKDFSILILSLMEEFVEFWRKRYAIFMVKKISLLPWFRVP